MTLLIEAAKEVHELQVNKTSSIDALRTQYFKLEAALVKHEFLEENQYIKYSVLELQELLVRGGYLQPSEILSLDA
jgi:hypothetical protein